MSYLWNIMELEETLGSCAPGDIDYFFDSEYNLHPALAHLSDCRVKLEMTIGEIRWLPVNNYSARLLLESKRVLRLYDDFFRQAKNELPWLPSEISPIAVDVLSKLKHTRNRRCSGYATINTDRY